jgi:hypothetical protein
VAFFDTEPTDPKATFAAFHQGRTAARKFLDCQAAPWTAWPGSFESRNYEHQSSTRRLAELERWGAGAAWEAVEGAEDELDTAKYMLCDAAVAYLDGDMTHPDRGFITLARLHPATLTYLDCLAAVASARSAT